MLYINIYDVKSFFCDMTRYYCFFFDCEYSKTDI